MLGVRIEAVWSPCGAVRGFFHLALDARARVLLHHPSPVTSIHLTHVSNCFDALQDELKHDQRTGEHADDR